MSRPRASRSLTEAERDRIAEALRLAERLGAETVTLPGRRTSPTTIARLRRGATTSPRSSSASPTRSRWRELLHGSVVARADPPAPATSASTSSPAGERAAGAARVARRHSTPASGSTRALSRREPRLSSRSRSASALLLQQLLAVANIALVFLTAVLVERGAYGLWPSLFACLAQRAGLQFLLPAAALHLHHRRPGERRRAVLLPASSR